MKFLVKQLGRWFFLLALLILVKNSIGQTIITNPLDGSKNQLKKDSLVTTIDKYLGSSYVGKMDTPYQVKNIITFEINESSNIYLPAQFNATAGVRIYYVKSNGVTDSIDRNLTVNYDTANNYTSKASFVFNNAHNVTVKILSITSSASNALGALMLENTMQIFPKFLFSCTNNSIPTITSNNPANTDSTDEIVVSWPASVGADVYDLEWAYVDSSALSGIVDNDSAKAALIFKNNATRITTPNNSFAIPLMYDNGGVLYYRVRAVQEKNNNSRIESNWSFGSGLGKFGFVGHQLQLNWQASTTFAEDGKRKTVVQYFDGSLRNRQTVTKDNTTNTTIVAETMFDYQGRPVIQVLPAPTINSIIKYTKNFNTGINGAEYDKGNYDTLPDPSLCCSIGATPMDSASGAYNYYSQKNPDKTGFNQYIPTAGGYPFTETEYTQDNTGRIKRQGGVGPAFRLGSGHETKYYYGTPSQNDLDALFGTEVGYNTHYFKNMVRDANGQYSVSYVDMHGRTIATALAGVADSANLMGLSTVDSYNGMSVIDTLGGTKRNVYKGLIMESKQSLVVAVTDTFQFKYSLSPQQFMQPGCDKSNICYNCLYDLRIKITDDCNNQHLPNGKPYEVVVRNFKLDTISINCDSAKGFAYNFTLSLAPGNYEVTKQLIPSESGFNYYRDSVFGQRNACRTLDTFLTQQRVVQTRDMLCYYTCDTCENKTEPQSILTAMLLDMSAPSGQYANPDNYLKKYSIFWVDPNNDKAIPVYTNPAITYLDETGKPDTVYEETSGSYVTPQHLSASEFATKFKPSWANALLQFHPEYCKLLVYQSLDSSYKWDRDFENTKTYADAQAKGYLNPTGVRTYSSKYPIVRIDTYSLIDKSGLDQKLNQYVNANANETKNLWGLATASVTCKPATDATCVNSYNNPLSAFNTSTMCTGDLDMAWTIFRGMYLQAKRDLISTYINSKCPGNATAKALIDSGYQPNFNTAADALTQNNFGYLNTDNNGRSQVTTTYTGPISDSLNNFYSSNCNSYAKMWVSQLSNCYTAQDLAVIIPRLVQVCKEGSDADHPMGSSSVKPSSTYQYRSFKEVIDAYNATLSNPNKLYCNADVITAPKPYDKQTGWSDKLIYTKPSDCECSVITQANNEYLVKKTAADTSLPAYLLRTRRLRISQADISQLLSLCTGSTSCTYLAKPIVLPVGLQCYVGQGCAECTVVESLYNQFTTFYGFVPTKIETDSLQRTKNLLFANYMNNNLGFGKQAWEYLAFRDSCVNHYTNTSICTNSNIVKIYNSPGTDTMMDVRPTSDHGYVMAGQIKGAGHGGLDGYIIKTDSVGNVQWAKAYGGTADDNFVKIRQTLDGGFVAIGQTRSFGTPQRQAFIVKTDGSGNVSWSRALGGQTANGESGYDILQMSDSAYAYTGVYNGYAGVCDWLVGSLSKTGTPVWTKQLGYSSSDDGGALLQNNDTLLVYGLSYASTISYPSGAGTLVAQDAKISTERAEGDTSFQPTQQAKTMMLNGIVVPNVSVGGPHPSSYHDRVILKINRNTGAVTNVTAYDNEGKNSLVGDFSKISTGYRINGFDSDDWGYTNARNITFDIDFSGNVTRVGKLTTPSPVNSLTQEFFSTSDGGYILGQSDVSSPSDAYWLKMNASGVLTKASRTRLSGNQLLYTLNENYKGKYVGAGTSDNHSLLMVTLPNLDFGCYDETASFTSTSVTVAAMQSNLPTVNNNITFANTNVTITATPVTVSVTNLGCGTDTCYSIYSGPYLCGNSAPVFAPVNPNTITPCTDSTYFINSTAYEMYKAYLDSVKGAFGRNYYDKCLNAVNYESFTVQHKAYEYHYTLYYYDQAGNLVKTVPPAGVVVNRSQGWLDSVKVARATGKSKPANHAFKTNYRYNTLNQVISQSTPDAGVTDFRYDNVGRLIVSKNAKQVATNGWSYTLYDALGRITEVGQVFQNQSLFADMARDPSRVSGWWAISLPSKVEVTKTFYDQPYAPLPWVMQARNLRNRVSWSATFKNVDSVNNFGYSSATFYSYDAIGNVDTLVQDFRATLMDSTYNRFKKLVYKYDLVSGKVNHVAYQPGSKDAFYHRYSYDAENRITGVEVSSDSVYWEKDASYQYYKHGPLARTVIGQQQVQGVDYAYTLQGWLKGVNSTVMASSADMGHDGQTGSMVAKDAYGFALHYYGDNRDYSSIGTSTNPFITVTNSLSGYSPLFNGNIAGMTTAVPKLGTPILSTYSYDVLNRLRDKKTSNSFNGTTNVWNVTGNITDYQETLDYDGNGNIKKLLRYGNPAQGKPAIMDSLNYAYLAGTNKLDSIRDNVAAADYDNDIDKQSKNNYGYDSIGNLVKDGAEHIQAINWTLYGKIQDITKTDGTVIKYTYDATGNRISKTYIPSVGTSVRTYYVRDASGNVMSIYSIGDNTINGGNLTQTETHLYGSSRLGIFTQNINVQDTVQPVTVALNGLGYGVMNGFVRGRKFFELSNHLGNVLVTISDRRFQRTSNGTTVSYYDPLVTSANDYYAFGMLEPGRGFTGIGYRYGFNGKENDNEVKGTGNQQDYGARIYDPRVGRFLTIDPLAGKYPWQSTYLYASDNPILFIDVNGESTGDPTPKYIYDALKVELKNMPASHTTVSGKIKSTVTRTNGIKDNSSWYWDEVRNNNPSMKWSKSNTYALDNGLSPKADNTFIEQFPEFSDFKNQTLEMHHLNQENGIGIALPTELHRGAGFTKLWHNAKNAGVIIGALLTLYQQTYGNDPLLVGDFTNPGWIEDEQKMLEYGFSQKDYASVSHFAEANNSRTGAMKQGSIGIYYASDDDMRSLQFFNLSKSAPGTFIVGGWGSYYPSADAASKALNKKVTHAVIYYQQNGAQGYTPVNTIQLVKPPADIPKGGVLINDKN